MHGDDEKKIAALMELEFYNQEIGAWGRRPRRTASVVTPSGCIEFDGSTNSKGYGVRRGKLTHREAVEQVRGVVIPDNWDVHHLCGNRRCYRDDHLQPKPHRLHAEEHATNRKLDADDVTEILRLLDSGLTHATIAMRFEVSRSCITQIKAAKRWSRIVLAYRASRRQILDVTPIHRQSTSHGAASAA